jgi:hypothetical protein
MNTLAAVLIPAAGRLPNVETVVISGDSLRVELREASCQLDAVDAAGNPVFSARLDLPPPCAFIQHSPQVGSAHWLDLPELRVVHACRHPRYLDYLAPMLTVDRCLTETLMAPATLEPADEAEKDSPEPSVFKAVEALLKGIEVPLPEDHSYRDKDGHERRHAWVRWWDAGADTVDRAALLSERDRAQVPAVPVPEHLRVQPAPEKPTFVGHYWMTGTPSPLSDKVVCVDHSVAKGGRLVAYRWEGEATTNAARFHWVEA